MPASIDMTGRVCGRLTVIAKAPRDGVKIKWLCRCECGNETTVDGQHLRSGHTKSCGCAIEVHVPALERFAEKIALTDSGCIEWLGGTNGVGYGSFYVGMKANPANGRGYAHRWSYEYHVGPIPDGLHLDHLCRNRKCVNPAHLEPVTIGENVRRGVSRAAINATKTHCPAGHPYAGDNLYVHPKSGMRRCRECGRQQCRDRRRKVAA